MDSYYKISDVKVIGGKGTTMAVVFIKNQKFVGFGENSFFAIADALSALFCADAALQKFKFGVLRDANRQTKEIKSRVTVMIGGVEYEGAAVSNRHLNAFAQACANAFKKFFVFRDQAESI